MSDAQSSAEQPPRPVGIWRRKKTYLWLLVGVGFIDGLAILPTMTDPSADLGRHLFGAFTLNILLLGWCYSDSEDRLAAISGPMGLLMLLLPVLGVPWYFIRSRGLLGGLKGGLGLGLLGVWCGAALVGAALFAVGEQVVLRFG